MNDYTADELEQERRERDEQAADLLADVVEGRFSLDDARRALAAREHIDLAMAELDAARAAADVPLPGTGPDLQERLVRALASMCNHCYIGTPLDEAGLRHVLDAELGRLVLCRLMSSQRALLVEAGWKGWRP